MHSDTLIELRDSLLESAREGKIIMLFRYPPGHQMHQHMVEKISGLEYTAKGIDLILAGGTSEMAREGMDRIISSIEELISSVDNESQVILYAERAFFLQMKDRFMKLDELLEVPHEKEDGEVILN